MDVEKCINKNCINYDKDDHNNCMTELDIKICPNHLAAPCYLRFLKYWIYAKIQRSLVANIIVRRL